MSHNSFAKFSSSRGKGKGKRADPHDGRMIDANKLVKALQDVQLQKKNAKKKAADAGAAPVEAVPTAPAQTTAAK